MSPKEAARRLREELGASDLDLLTRRELLRPYSFNARERNCLFVNLGGSRFLEAGYPLGVDIDLEGRGVAVADIDRDGTLDLLVRSVARRKLTYLHNRTARAGHFLRLDLEGTSSNRDAVGAVVRVRAGELRQIRVKMAGNGFQAQSEGVLHFGIGAAESVDEVAVQWPSGLTERFTHVPADRLVYIVEGRGRVEIAVGASAPLPRGRLRAPARSEDAPQ